MFTRHAMGTRAWIRSAILGMTLGCLGVLMPSLAVAAEAEKLQGSITWVPADAAFYSTTLRLGEQIEIVGKSRAWARLRALPAVQEALETLGAAAKSNPDAAAQLENLRNNPEVQRTLSLLGDMFSQEAFAYGGPDTVDVADLFQKVRATMNVAGAAAQLAPQENDEGNLSHRLLVQTLAENVDELKVPTLLFGFKVKNRDRAVEAVGKLEGLLNLLTLAAPQMAGKIKRTTVAESEFLTISVDGGMVPWDEIRGQFESGDVRKEDVDKVVARLKKMTLVIALGLRKDYLLLEIGPTTELLARLGEGKSLASLPELEPVKKYADRRLAGIGYVSEKMSRQVLDSTRSVRVLAEAAERVLPQVKLGDDEKAQIKRDIQEFLQDLERLSPKQGAMTSVDFLTDGGIEGYTYQWDSHPGAVADKPLGLLEHVGGRPILMAVGQAKLSDAEYDVLVKWLKVGKRYFEQFALPKMDEKEQTQYKAAVEKFSPMARRLGEVTRAMLIPSLDGQSGLVVDAKLKSAQFVKEMPALGREMPMAEPAVIVGLKDAEQFRKAMGEYRKLFNEVSAAVREMQPEQGKDLPKIEIPEPQEVKADVGTLYVFPLPKDLGVTEKIAPCLGVSDHVAAAAISQDHVRRLLGKTPLKFGGVLANADRPRVLAVGFDWAGLVDAASPWIEMAVKQYAKDSGPDKPEMPKTEGKKAKAKKSAAKKAEAKKPGKMSYLEQTRVVLDVLKTLRTITVEGYLEDGKLVTHRVVEIRDLPDPSGKK
jgi:hypothetical protein